MLFLLDHKIFILLLLSIPYLISKRKDFYLIPLSLFSSFFLFFGRFIYSASVFVMYCLFIKKRYYLASAKELMRINGTTKSMLGNHLAESIAGAITIRAFEKEERFFTQNLDLIDRNASPH